MPSRPKKACNVCGKAADGPYCDEHKYGRDRYRKSSAKRGYGHKWRKAREIYLARHPLCVNCKNKKLIVSASVVDHIKPHKGDDTLMWDEDNWQPLCKKCHDKKTASHDGGFGRLIK
jgi:5-methylcytosine-specific restriction protein A